VSERISTRSQELLATSRVAHLATADQYARPHIVSIVFAYEHPYLYTPIDAKRKSVDDWRELRRVRNVEANGRAAVLVDHYEEVWTRCAWVRLDGVADSPKVTTTGTRSRSSSPNTHSTNACHCAMRR